MSDSEASIARVQALNLKKDFPRDPEGRVLGCQPPTP